MNAFWKTVLSRQFRATIDMLENALRACPADLWMERLWDDSSAAPGLSEFWYIAYHSLFWLDLYLYGKVEGFKPPAPYTLSELDPAGVLPDQTYTRDELLSYLDYCRVKCQATIASLTEQRSREMCKFSWGEIRFGELLLDNMRHVQEHAAQLNMLLGQKNRVENRWIVQPKHIPDQD